MVTQKDRIIIRKLANRIAEIAELPIMQERQLLWKQHNRLERVRPLILVFPEGGWCELLPPENLQCESETARQIESDLRQRIYVFEHFQSDNVVEKEWVVPKVIHDTGWGLIPKRHSSTEKRGSWGFDPVLHNYDDLQKLTFPIITYDPGETNRKWTEFNELFGDILDVKLKGVTYMAFHLMKQYSSLRGLNQTFIDMLDEPQLIHQAMKIFEEGNQRIIQAYIHQNLFSLNNDNTYQSSGGVGYTDELPKPSFQSNRVRPCDIWASAESQELTQVSPKMHVEFALDYEKRLLEPFGLTGYACCDDLTDKLEDVFTIPHIRRISICPWANVDICAEKLKGKYIFSWKPQPSHLIGDFDAEHVRKYIQHTLDVTRNCVVEIILKDTHTCEHHPERFDQWTQIARDLVNHLD